jgi:hypothetical protein
VTAEVYEIQWTSHDPQQAANPSTCPPFNNYSTCTALSPSSPPYHHMQQEQRFTRGARQREQQCIGDFNTRRSSHHVLREAQLSIDPAVLDSSLITSKESTSASGGSRRRLEEGHGQQCGKRSCSNRVALNKNRHSFNRPLLPHYQSSRSRRSSVSRDIALR